MDPVAVHYLSDVESFSVEEDAVYAAVDEIQERGGTRLGGKVDDAAACVPRHAHLGGLAEVKGDIVTVGAEQG